MNTDGEGEPYRAYFEESPIGVFVTDAAGEFVDANPVACEMVGREREELLSLSIEDVTDLPEGAAIPSSFAKVKETGHARGEHQLVHADGRRIDVLLDTMSLGDDRFVAYVQDVSEKKRYERELERFKAFTEQSSDLITLLDENGRIQYNSPAVEDILGYSQDELIGENPLEYIHPRDRERVADQLQTVLTTTGRGPRAEFRIRDADGEWVWIESYGTNRLADPNVEGVIVNQRDITERKERERTLKQYERAVEQATDLLAAADTEHRLLFANKRYREFHGLSDDDIGTTTLEEVLGPEQFAEIDPRLDAVFEGETHQYEMVRQDPDGDDHHFDIRYYPLRSDYGEVVGIVATMRDITERKERRRKLKQYEYAVESSTDWIVAVDTDHRVLFANSGFRSFHGLDGDARGAPLSEALEESVATEIAPQMERALAGERVEFEHQTTSDGERRPVRSVVFPLEDDDGTVIGVVALIRDISELKDREQQLQVLDRVLRHNLNNKMNIVSGYAESIQDRTTDPFIQESAAKIRANSDQLTQMASKERAITKVLSDPPAMEAVDLATVAQQITSSVRKSHPAATITTELPEQRVEVVVGAVGRALKELLQNAVTHSDRERPAIEVRVRNLPDTVQVQVADDGPGIPEMERAVLTGESEIEPLLHGSGLGLWLVKLIVGRADGTLRFEENEPRGSVVTIAFPRPGTAG
ncbi:PAS domain S-box protein [Halobellus inordinatus]|uniref:PAS domain S-box protein n=1 Tax=Halobellus inordinatus TaxID=1126236 RepID=UPI00210B20B2|nr:PAS domain S-box protein [Halobellus inordinatus]